MDSRAYLIAADGDARRVPLAEAEGTVPQGIALVWMHVDGNDADCLAWLRACHGIPRPVATALTAKETRPRALPLETGALVNLRGVGEGGDPEDLVSIRLWAQAGRVISVAFRPLGALDDLSGAAEHGRVRDPGDLIAVLAEMLTARIDPVVFDLGDDLDALEEKVVAGRADRVADIREQIGRARLAAVQLRRYIAPQRDALMRLASDDFPFFEDSDRSTLVRPRIASPA